MATPPVPDKPTAAARFARRFRGYDPSSVDAFVRHVCRQLEEATTDNSQLKDQTAELRSKLAHFEDQGQALQDALVTAERLRREALDAAKEEAEQMRKDASDEAARLLDEAKAEAARVNAEADEVRAEVLTMREEAADQVEAIEKGAREHAETLAADIEREARENAERLSEEAAARLQELRAQVEKLEQRKAEFVAFVARELNGDGADSSDLDSLGVDELEVHFRGGAEPVERGSA